MLSLTKYAGNQGTFDAGPGKKTIDHTETQGTQRYRLLGKRSAVEAFSRSKLRQKPLPSTRRP